MTGIFDGLAGLLSDVFGGPVTHTPAGGADRAICGIFRAGPVDLVGDDGRTVLDVAPTLRVTSPTGTSIAVGDTIRPAGGALYRVLNRVPGGSPASDAFIVFDLELVS